MKKIFVTLAMIIACQGLFAQSIDDIFNQFKDKDGAEYINIPLFFSENNYFLSYNYKETV